MRYEAVREMYLHHWTYSGAKDEAKVHEMYHDDAILEFPSRGNASAARRTCRDSARSTRRG